MEPTFSRRLMGPDYDPATYQRSPDLEDRRAESGPHEPTTLEMLAAILKSFTDYHESVERVNADKLGQAPDVIPEWWGYSPEEMKQYQEELEHYRDD